MTFSHPADMYVLVEKLESEGINCFVQDEMMAQINPFYSNAIGGVKLQVLESDVARASQILQKAGYILEKDLPSAKIIPFLDKFTAKIPLLGGLRIELRFMFIASFIVISIYLLIYFFSLPSVYEQLTGENWCVEKVVFKGKEYKTHTQHSVWLEGANVCHESIRLSHNGVITFPGFNSNAVYGTWVLEEQQLTVSEADQFDFVYNGVYDVHFENNNLILKSLDTEIYCYPELLIISNPFIVTENELLK